MCIGEADYTKEEVVSALGANRVIGSRVNGEDVVRMQLRGYVLTMVYKVVNGKRKMVRKFRKEAKN